MTIDKTLDKIPFREDDCTIFDVLDNYIFTLMKYISVESNVLEITCCLNLYMRKPLNKDDIIKKIIFAIDCYTGEKDIDVQIVFDRGKPRLNTFFVNI